MAYINLQSVSFSYPMYEGSSRSLKRAVVHSVGGRLREDSGRIEVQALRDINLTLRSGDRLALLGHNGAGKSTLLKVLSGIHEPPTGRITREGTVSSMLDPGLGLDQEASGSDNIISRCIFLGMTYAEARRRLASIGEFTEVGPYLDMPLRTYSTGMLVRLMFAASTEVRPDILIMDELMAAGDIAFADRAKKRIINYVQTASILVLASHDLTTLSNYCNRGALLSAGSITMLGDIDQVIEAYKASRPQ